MEVLTDDRRLLRDYLLGRLDEPGRQQAERYFEDAALLDDLIEAENDLLDQYVRGSLSADERTAFDHYLACLPDREEKLTFAKALAEVADERDVMEAVPLDKTSPPGSWWQTWMVPRVPRARVQFGVAIVLIAVLAGVAVLLIVGRQRSSRDFQAKLSELLSEQQAFRKKVESLEQQLATEQTRAEHLQNELEDAEQRSVAEMQEIARLRSQPSPIASLAFPLLSLLKGGSTTTPSKTLTLVIKPHTQLASFTVPLADNEEYSAYAAVLQTSEGERVWEQEKRPLRPPGRSLIFRLPSGKFTSADYTLTVILTTKKDNLELPFNYNFTAIKE